MIPVSVMLYSSTDPSENDGQAIDANSYPPFKVVDFSVIQHIMDEVEALGEPEEEGQSCDHYLRVIP
jgi:transcription initiation factor TFIIH subunit 3